VQGFPQLRREQAIRHPPSPEALAQAVGYAIRLDANVGGWGWFVDPTPWDDSECDLSGNQGEEGRMDLLTVLATKLAISSVRSRFCEQLPANTARREPNTQPGPRSATVQAGQPAVACSLA
jgi:hypothetical protein